jgi:hypothetical protein
MRVAGLFVLVTGILSSSVLAQTTVVPPVGNRIVIGSEPRDQGVRAQISIQLLVPSTADDTSVEADKAREDARKAMYDIAARECALLLAALATECRLENVNVNVSRQTGARTEGFSVRGNMSYRITPK